MSPKSATAIAFVVNQLSLDMIGISLLTQHHSRFLQQSPMRPKKRAGAGLDHLVSGLKEKAELI